MGPKKLQDWCVVSDDITNQKALVGLCDGEWVRIHSLKSVVGRVLTTDKDELYTIDGPPYRQDDFSGVLKGLIK
jgi:hypothetical protein